MRRMERKLQKYYYTFIQKNTLNTKTLASSFNAKDFLMLTLEALIIGAFEGISLPFILAEKRWGSRHGSQRKKVKCPLPEKGQRLLEDVSMRCLYAYKIVKEELIFNNSNDKQKIDELINEWYKAIIMYANMFVKLGRFLNIQTRLPKNLQKTSKEYAENLIKRFGNAIFITKEKAIEMKKEIKNKIEKSKNIVSEKAIKHLEEKKIVGIKNNFIQLERNYVRTNDEFKTVIITTLEKYKTIKAWFRCKRKELLLKALNSQK